MRRADVRLETAEERLNDASIVFLSRGDHHQAILASNSIA
jgi:hypothetical protein